MSSLPISSLPGFPRSFTAPFTRGASEALRAPWHWLRANRQAPSRLTARLRKAAAKGQPIVLGTSTRPWAPSAATVGSPLAPLRSFQGLEIRVITRSPRILRNLEVLIDLDRDNAVNVDVVVSDPSLRNPSTRQGLELVRRLAGEGLQTRILFRAHPLAESSGRPTSRDRLRRFFEAAHGAGAFDVSVTREHPGVPWKRQFERLRLQHGFPLSRPGRG